MGWSSSEQEKTSMNGYNAISISSGDFCATFGRSKVVTLFLGNYHEIAADCVRFAHFNPRKDRLND